MKDLDCGADASKISGYSKSGSNFSQFKKKVIVMSMIFVKFEDFNNLLIVSTDDSIIRAWNYNGNQFVPINPVINDEPIETDIKILRAR
mmetsp:Transcript_2923/g.2763  ORF Transcript_2923/g.2763 Transcript_2923/m.2763 type:complete len:89 (-) Transcript_2923:795-1061(-)